MNAEAADWLRYARENLEAARICLENNLLNPSIHSAQQSVEKALKALCLHMGLIVKQTHSIGGLRRDLLQAGMDCALEDNDCDLLDAVYLPSKYPLASVLPDFQPDEAMARRCVSIAERVLSAASRSIAGAPQ